MVLLVGLKILPNVLWPWFLQSYVYLIANTSSLALDLLLLPLFLLWLGTPFSDGKLAPRRTTYLVRPVQ